MYYKIISINYYLLVVSDDIIKEGMLFLDTTDNSLWESSEDISNPEYKKIIAHLPYKDNPILDGIDLLPQLSKENYKKANYPIAFNCEMMAMNSNGQIIWLGEYIYG
jgi:hypothetical protein